MHLPHQLVLGRPRDGKEHPKWVFLAKFWGDTLGPRILVLKGSSASSTPSLLSADGNAEAQRGPRHCSDWDTYLGGLWGLAEHKFQGALCFLPWAGHTQLTTEHPGNASTSHVGIDPQIPGSLILDSGDIAIESGGTFSPDLEEYDS